MAILIKNFISLIRPLLFFILAFVVYFNNYTYAFRCQSCFAGCKTFDDCDCSGDENRTCDGNYCYAKLEYFSDDGVSAIQKGCTNEVSNTVLGCQYASDDRSIACFCSGDLCNSASNLSRYETPDLPLITCCECNNDESGEELCYPQNCTRNCTGNYCYLDMVANAQGCGWGHPQLFHFLRSKKYPRFAYELTCAEYYDNYRNYMRGCTCANEFCNVVADLRQLETRRKIQSDQTSAHFCHSLYAQSETAFGEEIYRHASLCPSYFCFISWTSVEVVFDPSDDDDDEDVGELGSGESEYYPQKHDTISNLKRTLLPTLRSTYEISAGCLLVDDASKVQIGCTTEWSQNEFAPLTKHCICSSKLCNDFNLIDDNRRVTTLPSSIHEDEKRLPFRHGSLSSNLLTTTVESVSTTSIEPDPIRNSDEPFVPVTSAFATSPFDDEKFSDTSTTIPNMEKEIIPTSSPPRPPKGQFRVGQTSSACKKGNSILKLVVFIYIFSILCTA